MGPTGADVYTHNELQLSAPPDLVWSWLVAASQWPRWYPNARRVRVPGTTGNLELDVVFTWVTFATPLTSRVVQFQPGRRLRWTWWCPGAFGYHGWLLEPTTTGTRVVTEETQRGPKITRWAILLRSALSLSHACWLRRLRRQVRRDQGRPTA